MSILADYTLVAVDGPRWFGLKQRHQHLMEGLSHHFGRTIYVEPSASALRIILKGDFPISELWEHFHAPKELGEKLWLIKAPPGLPRAFGLRRVNRINSRAVARKIKRHLKPDEKIVLWIGSPKAADMVDFLDTQLVIYDCYDAFSTFAWEAPHAGYIDELERRLLAGSEIILTTSTGLMEKAGKEDPRVHLIRNACDYDHFALPQPLPKGFSPVIDLEKLGKPLLGYFGDIAEWLDLELIKHLADSRPDWTFVFFGPPKVDVSIVSTLPNVHFPGRVPYDHLSQYVHHFDCLLIPFLLNDLTREVNPVKMYEYLATGIPIVSTAMPEVVRHEDVVNIGRNRDDFLAKIESSLNETSEEARKKRMATAEGNSWSYRIEAVRKIITDRVENG